MSTSDERTRRSRGGDNVGLCVTCLHHRVTGNRAGSRFYLCQRHKNDRRYPKYPPLPVIKCAGFEGGGEDPWERFARESEEEAS
jgi:hypothetical protein